MRIILQIVSAIMLCELLLACAGRNSSEKQNSYSENKVTKSGDNEDKDSLLVLDITKEYPNRDFNIQEIADIEYIPLETVDNVLLDGGALCELFVSDNLIVTCNKSTGTMFVFDRSGKIRYSFNHQGGGGNEYKAVVHYSVDFASNEIFIWDFYTRYRILVYSLEGDFKRVLKLNAKIWAGLLFDYNADSLFCYDSYSLTNFDGHEVEDMNEHPYLLISKMTGEVHPLNLIVKNRIDNCLHIPQRESYMVNIFPVLKSSEEIILSDFALDTVYSFKNNILQPIAIRKTDNKNETETSLVSVFMKTSKYIFWDIVKKRIVNNRLKPEKQILIQDRKTGEIWKPVFYNIDYIPKQRINIPDAYMTDLPTHYARRILSPERLIELFNKGELTGKLREAVSKLKADDNPVLMLVKYKE